MLKLKQDESNILEVTYNGRTLTTDLYFLYKIALMIKNGYSPIIGVCGSQRVGKSFVGLWVCSMIMKWLGKEFNPTTCTFYDPVEAIRDLEHKNYEPIIVDEASDLLNKREWFDKTHMALATMINTQSYKCNIYVIISPFIIDVDRAFVKHINILLRVDEQGRFKAFYHVKKYDAYKEVETIRRRFMDDVRIPKSSIPAVKWQEYLTYSKLKKEEMRKKRLNQITTRTSDPIDRLKKMLRY